MKILFLIASMRAGGAERVASTLCNHWASNGQQVVLVTYDAAENDFFQSHKSITRYSLNAYSTNRNIFKKIYANLQRLANIRSIVKQQRPDVVISFMDVSNMIAIVACMFTGVPVIISERTYPPYFNNNNLFDKLRKSIYKFCNYFVAQTSNVEVWAAEFLNKNKISVIANPLDTKSVQINPNTVREKKIVAVGRLCPEKGFDLLIQAFNKCQANCADWKLQIVGEGVDRAKLEQLIKDLDLGSKVSLTGQSTSPQASYNTAQIFVLSSRVEGFPNVLLEAMAHGLAVISFDCNSGPADLIKDGVNGLLVPAQQVDALALSMQRLMTNHDLRADLASAALNVRQRYKLEVISDQWIEVFKSVVT